LAKTYRTERRGRGEEESTSRLLVRLRAVEPGPAAASAALGGHGPAARQAADHRHARLFLELFALPAGFFHVGDDSLGLLAVARRHEDADPADRVAHAVPGRKRGEAGR